MKALRCVVVFAFLLPAIGVAQDKELRELGSSLATQIKDKGKGPVAIAPFTNSDYGPAFSIFLVDRLNILLAKGNSDFDVVTRDRIEEAFKEINLSLGKNYNAATFAKVGKHVGARSLVSGSYTVQASAAKVSIAAQILDVETGRIIGGEVAELPYTGDVKSMLTPQETQAGSFPEGKSATAPQEQLVEANDFVFRLKSCNASNGRIVCTLTVTSPEHDRWVDFGSYNDKGGWGHHTTLFDQLGNETGYSSAGLGSRRGDRNRFLGSIRLIRDVAVPAEVVFDMKSEVTSISLLQIEVWDREKDTAIEVQFRNIRPIRTVPTPPTRLPRR